MRILGIVCSPRKGGNTEILVKEALGSTHDARAEAELILTSGIDITPCDGRGACEETGNCKINDDMQSICQQLQLADGVIFGILQNYVFRYNITKPFIESYYRWGGLFPV